MFGLFRWLLGVFNKEHVLFTKYGREHPHFMAFFAVDALLSVSLVTIGFHYFGAESWHGHEAFAMKHPGIIPISAEQFLDYATHEQYSPFWLGKHSNNLYTIQSGANTGEVVSYYDRKSDSSYEVLPSIVVTTFANIVEYDQSPKLLQYSQMAQAELSDDRTVQFQAGDGHSEIVTFKKRAEVVRVDFAKDQSITDLMTAAANLKRIG